MGYGCYFSARRGASPGSQSAACVVYFGARRGDGRAVVPGLQALGSSRGRCGRCCGCHAPGRGRGDSAGVEGHRWASASRLSVTGWSGADVHTHAAQMGRRERLRRTWRTPPRARLGEGCGCGCCDAPLRRLLCTGIAATGMRHGFETRPTAPVRRASLGRAPFTRSTARQAAEPRAAPCTSRSRERIRSLLRMARRPGKCSSLAWAPCTRSSRPPRLSPECTCTTRHTGRLRGNRILLRASPS